METNNWYKPYAAPKKRRSHALKVHKGDKVATMKALLSIANQSKKGKAIFAMAKEDARYFYKQVKAEINREFWTSCRAM